jgi:uncharacterized protein with FMN-binding domain
MAVRRKGGKRVANGLVALGAAAVLTVYAAGFVRTRAAAQKLAGAERRRPPAPAPAEAGGSATPQPIEPPPRTTQSSQPPGRPTLDVARAATPRTSKRVAKSPVTAVPEAAAATAPASETVTPPPAATTTVPPASMPATVPPPNPEPTPPPPPKPLSLYKDGTYTGWGTSRHGDIQAAVVIEDGRIASAYISQCLTRYSCSWIAHLPPQIVSRQSPECDYVSGATQSTNAFYYAIVEALSKAK